MKFGLSQPLRRLLLFLILGVAPLAYYLGSMRPQQRTEYFLREHLRDLQTLSEHLRTTCESNLQAIRLAGQSGSFLHLPGGDKQGKLKKSGCDQCWSQMKVVERDLKLPMSEKLHHSFDMEDASGVTKQTSNLVFSSSCQCLPPQEEANAKGDPKETAEGDAKETAKEDGKETAEWDRKIDLKSVIAKMIGNSALAEYELFVADSTGRVTYHYGERGTRLLQFPRAAAATPEPVETPNATQGDGKQADKQKPGAKKEEAAKIPKLSSIRLDEMTGQSMIMEVEFVGRRFRLLTVPFEVSTERRDSPPKSTRATWVLGLLVPSASLEEKAKSFSYGSLTLWPLLIVAVLLCIPIIKVRSIGPRQPFTRRGMRWLAISFLTVPMILATVLVAWFTYTAWQRRLDDELRAISTQIQDNLFFEMRAAGKALQKFVECRAFPRAEAGIEEKCVWDITSKRPACAAEGCGVQELLDIYPFFHFVYWADKEAEQREKWSVEKNATPLINVSDYHPFFKDLLRQRIPQTVHTQVSPTTGGAITVLSQPITDGNGTTTVGVAAMILSPLSLINLKLPPGFSYAVIEASGGVVYQSVSSRSLNEDFLEETDGAASISALVHGQRDGFVEAHYHGRSHRLYVHPLATMPWSLIVMRDKEILRSTNLDIVLTWATLVLILAIVWLAIRVLVRLTLGRAEELWYWPDSTQSRVYTQIGAVLILWLVVMTWLLLAMPPTPFLLLATVVASGPLLMSFVFLQLTKRHVEKCSRALRNQRWLAYLICAAAMLCFIASAASVLSDASSRTGLGVAAALVVLALVVQTGRAMRERLDRVPAIRSWRWAYVGSGVLLVVVAAVLPSLILYRDALDSGMAAFIRHGQRKLAYRLALRADGILNSYSDRAEMKMKDQKIIDYRLHLEPDAKGPPWRWANAAKGLFWDGKLVEEQVPCVPRPEPDSAPEELSISWPDEWFGCAIGDNALSDGRFSDGLLACLPVYGPESIEMRSFVHGQATDALDLAYVEPSWSASNPRGRPPSLTVSDRRLSDSGTEPAVRTLTASKPIPTLPNPAGLAGWFFAIVVFASLTGLLLAVAYSTAHYTFGFGVESTKAKESDTRSSPSVVWAWLSDEEKSILYHLAKHGLVTPHPRAWEKVKKFVESGVLRLDPEPKFVDPELQDYVKNISTEADIKTWETGDAGSWENIRSIVQAGAVLLGVVLYFTQGESLAQWSGALTAAGALAGSLVAAMGALRGADKPKEKSN